MILELYQEPSKNQNAEALHGNCWAVTFIFHNVKSAFQESFSEKGTKMTSQLHILEFEMPSLPIKDI